jgi:hypothetical protein
MPNNYVLLDRIELNNTAASVTFDNIPQSGYTDLKLVISARLTAAVDFASLSIAFNGSTASFTSRLLQGDGSSAVSATLTNFAGGVNGTSTTTNTFDNVEIYIPNYRSANNKSFSVDSVVENNATAGRDTLVAGLWSNTAAITQVAFTSASGSFAANSTFSLYGLAQVGTTPTIAPKADGGNVIGTDGTYWYHAFLSNGTFTPQVGLSCDVLAVGGGGGGGGFFHAPGGGAGGLLYTASNSLTSATNYAVTIGSGGTGGNSSSFTSGTQGVASTFIGGAVSLTAVGGGRGPATGVGNTGGSGSGGGANDSAGGAGTSGQGNAGGAAFSTSPNQRAGGGGGAGAVGAGGSTTGNGGIGLNTYSAWATATTTGVSGYYAGGGGGGGQSIAGGSGGTGGGGAGARGANSASVAAVAGTINTGGGGGGGASENNTTTINNGAAGGSGIVIIRYLVA